MSEKIIEVVLGPHTFRVALPRDHDYFEENWRSWEATDTEAKSIAFASKVRPDMVFIDVGAWIGCMTLAAARNSKRVFAFEADPVSVQDLQRNIELNELTKVQVLPKLVSDTEGTGKLSSTASGNNSGSSMLIEDGKTSWTIEMIRLDKFIEEHARGDQLAIKMDIEGAEYRVLPTIRPFIASRIIREMCLSLHPHLISGQLSGNGIGAKLKRRIGLLCATWTALSAIRGFNHIENAMGKKVTRMGLMLEIAISGRQSGDNRELFLSD